MKNSASKVIGRREFIGASALAAATVSTLSKSVAAPKVNAPAKSKRDLMMQVLEKTGSPNYIPAGFFLHFPAEQRTGDAAIKAHHDYFRATGMDFVKIQKVAQLTSFNILHVCDYEGAYAEFGPRFSDYPGQIVNVPLSAEGKPLSLSQATAVFKRPVMGGIDRHGVLSTGTPAEVKKAVELVLKDAPTQVVLGANCTVRTDIPIQNLQMAIKTAHEFRA